MRRFPYLDRNRHGEVRTKRQRLTWSKSGKEGGNRLLHVAGGSFDNFAVGPVRESMNDHRSHLAQDAILDITRPLRR